MTAWMNKWLFKMKIQQTTVQKSNDMSPWDKNSESADSPTLGKKKK